MRDTLRKVSACAALALVCGGAEAQRPSLEEDLAAIAEFNRRYLEAINREDIDALSRLTTEGPIMLLPNRPPIVGKAANDEANPHFPSSLPLTCARPVSIGSPADLPTMTSYSPAARRHCPTLSS